MTRHSIFGYGVRLVREDAVDVGPLEAEFDLYPVATPDAPTLDIVLTDALETEGNRYDNPARHADLDDGFVAHFAAGPTRFQTGADGALVRVVMAPRKMTRFQEARQRVQSIQYAAASEVLGQILHELVLVPAVYFQQDLAPVHASAMRAADGSVVLIGGTGGVGKTSLELELCRRRDHAFLADDIAVVDPTGQVHPNMNFPKIYGYNVVDDRALERTLLKDAGPVDRMQWRIKHRASPAKVRRRISPVALYGGHATAPGPLRRYVLLVRDGSPGIDQRLLTADEAARMSLAVMQTEYNIFDNHVRWHEFNRIARGMAPILTMDTVRERWHRVYSKAFAGVECVLLRASRKIDHKSFVTQVADLITAPLEDP